MNEQTVKPCPRCNKPLYGIFGPAEGGPVDKMFWAECEGECPYFYAGYTREQCEEAWNRRASPEPSPSVREAAEKGVDTYLRAVANKEDFDLYDIFANAFRDFVPRSEFEKLRDEFWLVANQDGCAKWAGDKLDAILRRTK
jgi:hypothetical protein